LLALLSKQANTGYGLGRLLHGDLSHLWEASLQQIYCELGRLERDGLVEVELIELPNRPAKKVYSAAPGVKDDLALHLYCLDRIPIDLMLRRLERRRDARLEEAKRMRDRLRRVSRTEPSALGLVLTLERSLARAESGVAWCEKALRTLAEEMPEPARGEAVREASA
jgi:PadR family transcriptional regulator AphA